MKYLGQRGLRKFSLVFLGRREHLNYLIMPSITNVLLAILQQGSHSIVVEQEEQRATM